MSKTTDKKTRRTATQVALITSAADLGYTLAGGFQGAVDVASKLVPRNFLKLSEEERAAYRDVIREFGIAFRSGHMLQYLERRGYEKRLGNMDRSMRLAEMVVIMGKSAPDTDSPSRRTEVEQKAERTAANAWTRVRTEAGLKEPSKPRATRTSTANAETGADATATPPVDLAVATPVFADAKAAAVYVNRAANALARAVNASLAKNKESVPPQISSAVQDFKASIRAALAQLKAALPEHPAVAPRAKKANGSAEAIQPAA